MEIVSVRLRKPIIVVFIALGVAATPAPARAQPGCGAGGESDGREASAAAWCLYGADGALLSPLLPVDCEEVTYELVVADDTVTAVFPTQVIQDYTPALPTGQVSAGFDNHYGTVLNVLGLPGAPDVAPPEAYAIGSAFQSTIGERLFSSTSRWWSRYCWNADEQLGRLVGRADGPFGEGPVVPLAGLVAGAMARLQPSDPPPVLFAGPASLLQLPTWFWMNTQWWNTEHVDSAHHGRVSVRVTAVPRLWRLRIHGEEVAACNGRGLEYEASFRDDHPAACTFTFTESPRGPRVQLVSEVEFGVWWATSVEGYGVQSLPPILRFSSTDHEVREVVGLR